MSDLIVKKVGCESHVLNPCSPIKVSLVPKEKDLGGFSVRRLLPTNELQSVGPFIFFDHLGPAVFPPNKGIDVRPHPHIGLATITYVFEGEILHRDSLGKVQLIRPNEINWMTAGKGIAHSERTPPELRTAGHTLHALQLWIALPEEKEETEPFFVHYDASAFPRIEQNDGYIRVLIGEAFGVKSAVKAHSPTLYAEIRLGQGKSLGVPEGYEERAAYVVSGCLSANRMDIPVHTMAVFDNTPGIELTALEDTRLIIIGGTPLGQRIMWWNLVATRQSLIDQVKLAWRERTFPTVPLENEYIPLPE